MQPRTCGHGGTVGGGAAHDGDKLGGRVLQALGGGATAKVEAYMIVAVERGTVIATPSVDCIRDLLYKSYRVA